jgi:thymidylate synthase
MRAEEQYLKLCKDLIDNGTWVDNERTGKSCLSLPTAVLTYTPDDFPILQSKQVFWKGSIREITGYANGYTSAKEFRALGVKTWDMNANETQAWLDNPLRKGTDDMGKVYGAIAKDFGGINLFDKVINNLKQGIDDRGEIITFWKPDDFDKGCLRPCMHSHQFMLIGDTLHLTSTQRSCDVPLGMPFNMIQCWWLLNFMCSVTNLKQGNVTHVVNHPHIYEDQLRGILTQLQRSNTKEFKSLRESSSLSFNLKYHSRDYTYEEGTVGVLRGEDTWEGTLSEYEHMGKITFPFSK